MLKRLLRGIMDHNALNNVARLTKKLSAAFIEAPGSLIFLPVQSAAHTMIPLL
jgi:hypothetical protein